MLQIKNLYKEYQTTDVTVSALNNLSITVDDGEFVAIMGRSGSGKTTLLNVIGGLLKPDSGSVVLDGRDLCRASKDEFARMRRRKIGMVFQFFNLIPELNIKENIILPSELDGVKIDDAWLEELLDIIELSDRKLSFPEALSGGQQQRVAIARALFSRPSLVLADEPTGNLDRENSTEIMKLLRKMNQDYGVTILMVTHSTDVASYAQRIIEIDAGTLKSDRKNTL